MGLGLAGCRHGRDGSSRGCLQWAAEVLLVGAAADPGKACEYVRPTCV